MVNVLLFDPDEGRAGSIEAVLGFLEHKVCRAATAESLDDLLNGDDSFATALLAGGPEEKGWHEALRVLNENDAQIPVFLVVPPEGNGINPSSLGASVMGVLDLPLRQGQFEGALRQALTQNAKKRDRGGRRGAPAPRLVGQSHSMQRVAQLIRTGGRHGCQRPDPGGVGHWQGGRGAEHPPPIRTPGQAVCPRELRRHSRGAAGERTLRP